MDEKEIKYYMYSLNIWDNEALTKENFIIMLNNSLTDEPYKLENQNNEDVIISSIKRKNLQSKIGHSIYILTIYKLKADVLEKKILLDWKNINVRELIENNRESLWEPISIIIDPFKWENWDNSKWILGIFLRWNRFQSNFINNLLLELFNITNINFLVEPIPHPNILNEIANRKLVKKFSMKLAVPDNNYVEEHLNNLPWDIWNLVNLMSSLSWLDIEINVWLNRRKERFLDTSGVRSIINRFSWDDSTKKLKIYAWNENWDFKDINILNYLLSFTCFITKASTETTYSIDNNSSLLSITNAYISEYNNTLDTYLRNL